MTCRRAGEWGDLILRQFKRTFSKKVKTKRLKKMLQALNFDPDVRSRHYGYNIDGDVEEVEELSIFVDGIGGEEFDEEEEF